MKTPEKFEKDDIKKYLDSIGAWYTLTYTGGFGKSGAPDIVACVRRLNDNLPGTFWGIEVKREGKEPTKLQTQRLAAIQATGGMAVAGTAEIVIKAIERWRR
jgi:hypothetical protein